MRVFDGMVTKSAAALSHLDIPVRNPSASGGGRVAANRTIARSFAPDRLKQQLDK
jgi:hypothetical protein